MSDLKEFLANCKCAHRGGDSATRDYLGSTNYDGYGLSISDQLKRFELEDEQTLRCVKVMVDNPEWFKTICHLIDQNTDFKFKGHYSVNLPKLVGTLKDFAQENYIPTKDEILSRVTVNPRDEYEIEEFVELFELMDGMTLSDKEVQRIKATIIANSVGYTLLRLGNGVFDALGDLRYQADKERIKFLPDIDKLFEILERAKEQVKIAREVQGILSNNKNDGNNYGDE